MAIVLANTTLATLWPPRVHTGAVEIAGESIKAVGEVAAPEGAEVIHCRGRLVMPGNVCGHTHLYSALARGMPPPPRVPRNFVEILQLIWWRLDRALDSDSIRASALV